MNKKIPLFCLLSVLVMPTYVHGDQPANNLKISGLERAVFDGFHIDTSQPINVIAAELLHALEQSGYILATVSVTQENSLHVDLGRINKITVTGLDPKAEKRARAYIQAAINHAAHVDRFDRAVTLINDLPGVSASLAFQRNIENGGYEVIIAGEQRKQFGVVSLDSTPRNLFNQNRINLQQEFYSVLIGGDIVRFQGAYINGDGKPEQRSLYGSYQMPLGNDGAYAEVSFGDIQSETFVRGETSVVMTNTGFSIIPGAVTNHDFEGQTASLIAGYPLVRSHDRATYLIGSIDYNTDETETVGEIDSWAGDISLFRNYNSPTGYSLAGSITLGGGYTDSFIDSDDGRFGYLQAGFGYIQPLDSISPRTEVRVEAFGQIATKDTPNSKTIGLGSTDFLRGYESSTFTGTSGTTGTIELAHAYDFSTPHLHRITPYVFLDAGYVANPSKKQNTTTRPDGDALLSYGAGAKINFAHNLQMNGYVGIPVLEDYNSNVPDPRGYMKIVWSW